MNLGSLPYDMGNAGDLLKHGLLAEFAQWLCPQLDRPFRFLDPFAGRPWAARHPRVAERLKKLPPCALLEAQPDPAKYCGSTFVVLNALRARRCDGEAYVSDKDPNALAKFDNLPTLKSLEPAFSPSDGFSILDTDIQADLVLLDPYGDFLRDEARDPSIIPKVSVFAMRVACVLFILNMDPTNWVGRQYDGLRQTHLPNAWRLLCPKLEDTGVRGESKYNADVLLAWDRLRDHPLKSDLHDRLTNLADGLTTIFQANVTFESH